MSPETRIAVTADRPYREVVVETQLDDERRLISLQVGSNRPDGLSDQWTWLAPVEARQVAAALIAAADEMERENV